MVATDARGQARSYLASEENFDVAEGPRTRRTCSCRSSATSPARRPCARSGPTSSEHGGTVTAFYLSNVEQYLDQDGLWPAFCANVATLPLDDTSTFIRSVRPGPNSNGPGAYGMGLTNQLGKMAEETKACPK